ncbi:MAG: hypothetical protein H7287_03385 [Thermoleophilia bacterium]|nr:hypothetical protein [Thermoleophilia bacterium]
MNFSWHDISAAATTAAVSFGSAANAIGGGAAGAMASVASQVGTGAGAIAGATSQVHANLALVEKPVSAAARGIGRSSMLLRASTVLSRALPVVAIGASTLSGASIVEEHGASALFTSRQGRSAVLGALGGSLLLVPTPVTQVAAAAALGALAVNEFGGMDRLGTVTSSR